MELEKLFSESVKIEGQRIFLRPVTLEDAKELLPMYADESIYQFRPGMPRKTVAAVEKLIRRGQQDLSKESLQDKLSAVVYFVIVDKSSRRLLGVMEVFHMDTRVEQVEIGYTLIPEFQNKGYVSEAIGILTDFLVFQVGFNRVRATVYVKNAASCRVLEKNGFTFEGTERQGEFWQGMGFVDINRYAKLKQDYT